MSYRMYVDEVGNHQMTNLATVQDPNHRFLSLTGVIMSLENATDLAPRIDALKTRFCPTHHVDHPVVLHRKEIMQKLFPFDRLRDPAVSTAFDQELLSIITETPYTVISVVIDKVEHDRRYGGMASHPYHYCMGVLLERYIQWLEPLGSGDVMFECRGKVEDKELRAEFRDVVKSGTRFVSAQRFDATLVRKEPRLMTKKDNVAGLQLADVVAHPSYSAMRCTKEGTAPKATFGLQIARVLEESKYRRQNGCIDGYGRKWLP